MSDDRTLVEILSEDEAAPSAVSIHDAVAARLMEAVGSDLGSGRFEAHLDDAPEWVAEILRIRAGRVMGPGATWLRIVNRETNAGVLAVVHCPNPLGEAEMILVWDTQALTRAVIRDLCSWAFLGLGLLRVVVRIHAHDTVTAKHARRLGFDFEGRARDFFSQGYDASVFGMSIWRCRWLPQRVKPAPHLAISPVDVSPPSSNMRH